MIQKNKKSQLTIFLILAVVLIILVAILLMITRYVNRQATSDEIIDSSETTLDIQPIKLYIEECLSIVSKDGLVKLGKQGGYLFKSQGGTVKDYPPSYEGSVFVQYGEEYRIVYNILKPRFQIGNYYAEPKDYPWINFPYDPSDFPDDPSNPSTPTFYEAQYAFGTNMMPDLVRSRHSIQKQLEAYVENNIDKCLDLTVFEEQGFRITEKDGSRDVTLNINENDIVFTMNYPLIVESLVSGERTEIKDFLVRHDFNLKQIHSFINGLIEKDISDIKFDIKEEGSVAGFNVERIRDIEYIDMDGDKVKTNDDLILITAQNSLIDGVPYQYYFMRKNRNPALEYIINTEYKMEGHEEWEDKCIYDPKIRKVTCGFEWWYVDIDGDGPLTSCKEHAVPPEYTIYEDYFLEEAHDPDEDNIDDSSFTYKILTSGYKFGEPIHGGCGAGGTIKIEQTVSDGELKDWQTVTFFVDWVHIKGKDEDCVCVD